MAKKKQLFKVFGKKKGETFGNFYSFLSTSKEGAGKQARKIGLKVLDSRKATKIKTK